MDFAALKSPMLSVGFFPSLKYCVLKYIQVGVRTNPPDWFWLCLNKCNSFDYQKG